MSTAEDNITPLPTLLERVGRRIDNAWIRICKGESEWVEGSLELAQALAEGRGQHKADQAFGQWLTENKHNHVNHMDRAALLGMAVDLKLAREVLTQTESRSYRLIWAKEKDRFSSAAKPAGKPDKPKRRGRRHKDRDGAIASIMLDEGKSRIETAVTAGVTEHIVQLTMERELGRREMLTGLLDAAGGQHYTDKGWLRIEDAIRIHTARLDKQFEQRVNEEVRRRIAAADDFVREENKRLCEENLNLERMIGQRGVFTEAQFRGMLKLCHPDDPASPETRAALLQLLVRQKKAH